MNDKNKYRALCDINSSIPLFHQAWWLDAVSGTEGWEVVLHERDNQIIAALPYVLKKRMGFNFIGQPSFTQTLGVWIAESKAGYYKKIGQEKEICHNLIDKLPRFDVFFQAFSSTFDNWTPFYIRGFEQTTKYSYLIDDLSNEESLWKNLSPAVRRDIRKAGETLRVVDNIDAGTCYEIIEKTYARQGQKTPYSKDRFVRFAETILSRGCGRMVGAVDDDGRTHAVALIAWDHNRAYYLFGGGDPELRKSNGASLCIWDSIRFAAGVTKSFDFEGSMVENIERFFRGFGGRMVPYSRIFKINNLALRIGFEFRRRMTGKI